MRLDQIVEEPLNWDEIDLEAFEQQHPELIWELRKATFLKKFDYELAARVLSRVMDRRITAAMVRSDLESSLRDMPSDGYTSCFECLLDVSSSNGRIEASVRLHQSNGVGDLNVLAAGYVAVMGNTK
jgi:hypothetical protein